MEKVLIISTNALGDTYLSASALKPLRQSNRYSEIHFVTSQDSHFLIQNLSVDKVYYLTERSIINIFRLLKEINRNEYGAVFTFFPGIINSFFFHLVKSPLKAGFPNYVRRDKWYNIPQKGKSKGTKLGRFLWKPDMNYLQRIQQPLESVKIESDTILKYVFSSLQTKTTIDRENKYITIHFRSRDRERSISDGDVIRLCLGISKTGAESVILVGGVTDFSKYLLRSCKENNFQVVIQPSLEDLICLIINARVFVGVDSFPLHIADAYNCNFLGIFGPTNPSSVLVNSRKSIRFNYSTYINIDVPALTEEILRVTD